MKVLFRAAVAAALCLAPMLAPVSASASTIVARVSVSTQTMHVYINGMLRYEWPVSTGGRAEGGPTSP